MPVKQRMAPDPVAKTARLVVRRVTRADAPFLLRLLNEPSWIQNIGDRNIRSLEDAEGYIHNHIQAQYHEHGYGMYLLELSDTRRPIGMCGLVRRDTLPGPDLGFALAPEYAGHGYAREAAHAVVAHAGKELGIETLYAIVKPDNRRSVHLLERLGFKQQGRYHVAEGEPLDRYVCTP